MGVPQSIKIAKTMPLPEKWGFDTNFDYENRVI